MVTDTDTFAPAADATTSKTPTGRASASKFAIAGDKIALATTELPDEQREAIRWAAGYCRARNLSHHDLAARLKKPDGSPYSADSVYHMFTGGRTTDQLGNMVTALQRLREIDTERDSQVRVSFIETSLTRRIFETCRRAFLRQKMIFIFGDSQIGKTTALEEYAERYNHGETKYVRMPPGGGFDIFVRELADSLGLPTGSRTEDLRRRILDCFDSRMLLVVDECEECLTDRAGSLKGVQTLNFIREIYDKKKCGVILAGANIFKKRLLLGHNSPGLQRLVRRGLIPLQLPNVPPRRDLAVFAEAYGLPEIEEKEIGIRVTSLDEHGEEKTEVFTCSPLKLQTEIIGKHGLGLWTNILQEASDTAREKKRAMSWGLVLHAWHRFEQESKFAEEAA